MTRAVAAASTNSAVSARRISPFSAFITSGRFSVRTVIPPVVSIRTVSAIASPLAISASECGRSPLDESLTERHEFRISASRFSSSSESGATAGSLAARRRRR